MIGFEYAQAVHDNLAEPDTDVCEGCADNDCDRCDVYDGNCCNGCLHGGYEEDPDDARDRAYAYGED